MAGGNESQITPTLVLKIDEICTRFEAAWDSGQPPRIEDYLDQVEPADRPALFQELLRSELASRAQMGESPSQDEYQARFPEKTALIETVFSEWPSMSTSQAPASGGAEVAPAEAHTQDAPAAPRDDDADSRETVKISPRAATPRSFNIRCPHCDSGYKIQPDTDETDFTCAACGNHFSILGDHPETQTAPTVARVGPEGRFELIERLGMGGFGTVWKARDTQLNRTVAVKIPRKGRLDRKEVEQFMREARLAAQLRHAHINTVHDCGRHEDSIYIVSDLVRGVSLSDYLTGQRMTPREAAELCLKIAKALHYAHEKHIVHRDLKPGNIMIDADLEPQLMDFGLAKSDVGDISLTVTGQVIGTPAYMSPEQAEGRPTDRRGDIYSLGVILFELLAGELPFRGNVRMQLHQKVNEEPPSPRKLNAAVPVDLETVCLKCLEKPPDRRYQTAQEVADELERYLRGEPIKARPVTALERAWRWGKRHPMETTAIGALLFLTIAIPVTAIVLLMNSHAETVNETAREVEKHVKYMAKGAKRDFNSRKEALDNFLKQESEDSDVPIVEAWIVANNQVLNSYSARGPQAEQRPPDEAFEFEKDEDEYTSAHWFRRESGAEYLDARATFRYYEDPRDPELRELTGAVYVRATMSAINDGFRRGLLTAVSVIVVTLVVAFWVAYRLIRHIFNPSASHSLS
jgi:hypothetical protein